MKPRSRPLLIEHIVMGDKYTLPQPWELAVQGWVEWLIAAGSSAETVRTRRGCVRSIARQLDGNPDTITTRQIVDICASRDWSNDHRRSIRTSLIAFYDWLGGANPAKGLPQIPESKPRPRPVTDRIWQELLDTAPPRERMMARLAGEAGLRRAEVAKVHRDDISEDINGWSLIVQGKGDKQRTIPITDSLANAINQYRSGYSPRGYLFPGQIDGHISPNRVGVVLSNLMPPGWSMHKLRHRYASRGFAGTGNIRAVQEALGHASVATTQRYTAVSSRDVRAVSEAAA